MKLAEQVFTHIVSHWEKEAERLAFFAKNTWHSYEEWLNWEAAYACSMAGLQVLPKTPYSACGFKQNSKQLADLTVAREPFPNPKEAVIIEIALVHGNSQSAVNDKVRRDWDKFDNGDLRRFSPMQIIVAVTHPENTQGKTLAERFRSNHLWVRPTDLRKNIKLPGGGLCEVKGWIKSPQ